MQRAIRLLAATAVGGLLAMGVAITATTASAGIDTGKVEARLEPASQVQGGTVTLVVTVTQDRAATSSTRHDVNLGFDGRALTLVRHSDPGDCRSYPASSQPPETIDTAVYCDQTPGRPVQTDRFTFSIKPGAPVGPTTLYAGANYGSATASAPRITLTITPAPLQGGGGGPIQGGDGGVVQGPGAGNGSLCKPSDTTTNVRGETDRLLLRTSMSGFLRESGRFACQLDWSTDGCSRPLTPEPERSQPSGFDFRNACWRHDFGYRNYKQQDRFKEPARRTIDDNFLKDMNAVCDTYRGANAVVGVDCRNHARTYYQVVRLCGSSPQPLCAGPIIATGKKISDALRRMR